MKTSMMRKFGLALLVAMLLGGVAGCEDEGPMEEAGENMDEATEDAGESMEEMGEDMEESAEDAQN